MSDYFPLGLLHGKFVGLAFRVDAYSMVDIYHGQNETHLRFLPGLTGVADVVVVLVGLVVVDSGCC